MLVDISNKIRLILTHSELFGLLTAYSTFFPILLSNIIKNNNYVLIYPEKEMWFNYRKPRPFKRGPYYYAARLNIPVISCFVEMCPQIKKDNDQFKQINYHVHILKPIYPDPNKTLTENSLAMMEQDYSQKKQPMNPLIILS